MTVIERKQQYFTYPSSVDNSSTESLHLDNSLAGSDIETNEPCTVRRKTRPRRIQQVEELTVLKKYCGKKKLRRYESRKIPQTLNEEDEIEADSIEPSKTPLTRLLENSIALAYWNDFIDKSQEDQIKTIEEFPCKVKRDVPNNDNTKFGKTEKTFKRIPFWIRLAIKARKNVSLEFIKKCEEEFISFFKETSDGVIVKINTTSLERILLRAVALYHKLNSEYVSTDKERIVSICNPMSNDWTPADCLLTDFIIRMKQ